jgi:hypothetical protein
VAVFTMRSRGARALDAVEATVPDVEAIDPDLAGQLADALGWLATGDGTAPMLEDWREGVLRLWEVIGALKMLALPQIPWSQG